MKLIEAISAGCYDRALARLYCAEHDAPRLDAARNRARAVADSFCSAFPENRSDAALFSGPGRTEIGGNHTDHQHGRVLCASVDLDTLACAAPNGSDVICVRSEGYPELTVKLDELSPKEAEKNSSAALVRGVAAKIAEQGYSLSGVDVSAVSNVLSGSGLSSSAAYEILIGNILNHFFCGGKLDAVALAKIGQYAENVYFGKPCGLMDQMGSSVGGAVAIDFADPAAPVVRKIAYDFSRSGHALCIVDTGSSHDDLTEEYAAVPREMGAVAEYFGKRFLREVPEAEFRGAIPALRERCGDRAVLRAMHFYDDDRRAAEEAEALNAGAFDRFLALVNASGRSSETMLQNVWAASAPGNQAVTLALAIGRRALGGAGAIRVHGGGFAGTIQAFVPLDRLDRFRSDMEAVLGEGKCHILRIRPVGGCAITEQKAGNI